MFEAIEDYLNSITMYRLMVYGLVAMLIYSVILSFFGLLPYQWWQLLSSAGILFLVCHLTNLLISRLFGIQINVESSTITGLILFFILSPLNIQILVWTGLIAVVSKYFIAINKKHLFNPSALALVLLGSNYSIWWVGIASMLPVVLVVGLLVVAKLKRFHIFVPFFIISVMWVVIPGIAKGFDGLFMTRQAFSSWPIVFFGTIMLTEPLTTPPSKKLQIVYGILVGALFGSQWQLGSWFMTPELSLIIGNIFSFAVGSRNKHLMRLIRRVQLTPNTYEFLFLPGRPFSYLPGQFLEWTFPHENSDSRGVRRFFTIASSPTEKEVKIGIRFNTERSSSFKTALMNISNGERLVASQLQGDFILPRDTREKLVFIAGGIGVTPFRSMAKYLLDKKEIRDVVLFCVNREMEDIVYKHIFDKAKEIGLRTVYVLTSTEHVNKKWKGRTGRVDEKMIR